MIITGTYILSQMFFLMNYAFLFVSYYVKEQKKVVWLNILCAVSMIIAYILMKQYAGLGVAIVSLLRNFALLFIEKIFGKSNKMNINDWILMITFVIAFSVMAIYTYKTPWDLLALGGALFCTVAICQKNVGVYRWLGLAVSMCWIIYNIYIRAIVGIVFELILLIGVIFGIIKYYRKDKVGIENELHDN